MSLEHLGRATPPDERERDCPVSELIGGGLVRTINCSLLLPSLIILCGGTLLTPTSVGNAQETGPQKVLRRDLGAMAKTAAPVDLGTKQVTVKIALNKDAGAQIQAALAPTSSTPTHSDYWRN